MFGESYLGRRVFDVLSTLNLLYNEGAQEVRLYGRGQGAILALFAGLLDPRVVKVVLKNGPASFQEWATVPIVQWPAANVVPGVLKHLDVADCLRLLGERAQVIDPWGPGMAPRAAGVA